MFKGMLNETIKVSEESLEGAMGQIKYEEKSQEQPTNMSTSETENKEVEITAELVEGLIKKIPELEGIDPIKLEAGMKVEMEHIESVGNNIEAIAKIAADHIKEFPEADYYEALAAMEASLVPPPVEEAPTEETPAEHEASETPAEEEVEEEAKEEMQEEEVEEAKKDKGEKEGSKSKAKDKKEEEKEKKENK